MKKTEEMSKAIGVEELAVIAKKQPEVYQALKHYCMNRGFAEIRRFAKRMMNMAGGKAPVINEALSEKQNAKMFVLVIRIAETADTALKMYDLFHLCDNAAGKTEDDNGAE